jgi:Tol biopolymer transport system component
MNFGLTLFCCLTFLPAASADEQADLPLQGERQIEFTVDRATWMSVDVSPDDATLVVDILGDLYTLSVGGGAATRLTSGMAFDSQPQFSPDGQKIAFTSDRDGQMNLWLINADGSQPEQLSKEAANGEFASPIWSPDGSHIVVSRNSWQMTTYELWAYHIDGGSGVQLTKAKNGDTARNDRANALGAQYSPDGRYLYFASKKGGFGYNLRFPQW